MPKNKVSEWSGNPADNLDVGGIDIAENCAPSNINNAIREVMAQVKDMQAGVDGDNFAVAGNLSVTGTSTLTGNVTASGTLAVTGLTTATGGVNGDIFASNGTSKILENGTDGTNATFTGSVTGTATTATNIAGGAAGRIPYNTAAGATAFIAAGTAGQILQSNGTSAPTWVNGGLAIGQTWQDVSTSRLANTTYTNSTGKPIMVNVYRTATQGTSSASIDVDAGSGFVSVAYVNAETSDGSTASAIIPAGHDYRFTGAFSVWAELR